MKRILIIEDDNTFSRILQKFLQKKSFEITTTARIGEVTGLLDSKKFDLLLLDYRLPDGTAMELLNQPEFRAHKPRVIIMTAFNDIRTAVRAIRLGVYDYITKPVNPDELMVSIEEALQQEDTNQDSPEGKLAESWITGQGEASRHMHNYINLVAPTNMSVLIHGESGTGKEYAARAIHQKSSRSNKPFVAIDCGVLTPELSGSELFGHIKGSFTNALQDKKGHFEAAHEGTLFLDEISNLSLENQVKLLRAIQERSVQPIGSNHSRKVDVRLITATNDDLLNQVREGSFREDLYHRINEFKISIPALRERTEDLELFINHFMEEANRNLKKNVSSFTPRVMEILKSYSWPGNLRELRNCIRRAVLLAEHSAADINTLPTEMLFSPEDHGAAGQKQQDETDLKAVQEANETILILKTLEKVRHNKSKAAKLLNIDRKTLYNKLSRYNIR